MSNTAAARVHSDGYNRGRLFLLSVVALVAAGMVFSIRAATIGDIQGEFFDPIAPSSASEWIGFVAGVAFLSFAVSIFIGSPLCDYIGMRALLGVACVSHILGSIVVIFAGPISNVCNIQVGDKPSVYWILYLGMLIVGIGHGLVEAVINPLAATLYPEDKTHRLNVLHAWWPGGIIIGGVLAYLMGKCGATWQVKQALVLIPACWYGYLLVASKFPPTERVASGVSSSDMWKQAAKPLFIIFFLSMFLTAASELAPGQWLDATLTATIGFQGILLLVYVNAIMFVMRHFAGPLAHKLSPVGLLWWSCLLAALGLVGLSYANSPVTGLLAATVWAFGVCYMWPTMLGVTSERFPRGGALLMGLMGTAGNLSIKFVLPWMGGIYDKYKVIMAEKSGVVFDEISKQAQAANAPAALVKQYNDILTSAAPYAFRFVAVLPAILLVVFGAVWLYDKARGGYKIEKLTATDAVQEGLGAQAPVE